MTWITVNDPEAPVLLQEARTASGFVVGHVHLNAPATLNSLSLEMIDLFAQGLADWSEREDVAAIVVSGSGEKAFCAGGDVQALYRSVTANHAAGKLVDTYAEDFFTREYRLDHAIHTCTKPTIALGHGIVMGGGLGVLSGCDLRVLTERSRIGMPEITIGLFPDAGATWLLRNMPRNWALFVAMTGASINALDALRVGIGTHSVHSERLTELLPAITGLTYTGSPVADRESLDALLQESTHSLSLPAELDRVTIDVDKALTLPAALDMLNGLAGRSEWIDRGLATLASGCPTTAGIIVEQLNRASTMTLADCFRMELVIGTHCARNHDFAEGVRALLIEKDRSPKWQYPDLATVPQEHVLSHFVAPWEPHPLADLED